MPKHLFDVITPYLLRCLQGHCLSQNYDQVWCSIMVHICVKRPRELSKTNTGVIKLITTRTRYIWAKGFQFNNIWEKLGYGQHHYNRHIIFLGILIHFTQYIPLWQSKQGLSPWGKYSWTDVWSFPNSELVYWGIFRTFCDGRSSTDLVKVAPDIFTCTMPQYYVWSSSKPCEVI